MKTILLRAFTAAVCLHGSFIHAASPEQILSNLLNGFLPQSKETTATATPVCVVGTTLYFEAYDATTNSDGLWKSDGTASGTVLVKGIVGSSGSSTLSNLTAVGDTLFFSASDHYNGEELWKSDGTTAGTVPVKDINAGSGSSTPSNLTAVGSTLYFTAYDGINGTELWKSDGTTAGTVLVKDISAGSSSSAPIYLTAVENTLFFYANDTSNVSGLWKSDGTAVGTAFVKDIRPSFLAAVGRTLFFGISNLDNADSLWKIDGTTGEAVLVRDLKRIDPGNVTAVGNTLFFTTSGESGSAELWKSDGSRDATELVKIFTFPFYFAPTRLKAAGDTLFFQAKPFDQDHELWKSDGKEAGTTAVNDLTPNSIGDAPFLFAFAALMQTHLDTIYDRNFRSSLAYSGYRPPIPLYLINPEIIPVADQAVPSGFSTAAITFTTSTDQVFDVSALSSDQTLVRDADIILGHNGFERTVTVKSAANVSGIAIITLTVTNRSEPEKTATESFALTITPGKPQNFSVSFTPKGKPVTDGQATRQFGSVPKTNKAGTTRKLTLTNIGKKALTGLKILKDGNAAADFIIKGLNKKPLPRGESITFDVIFRPKAAGSKQAFLHITSSESIENPFDLTLTGTGAGPKRQR